MKKALVNLLLLSTFLIFTSYNTGYIRIPLEKKLREIEQDKYEKQIADCKCKSFRYNMNLREADKEVNMVIGWVNDLNVLHAYLKDEERRILDPTFRKNQDGVIFEKGMDYKDIYFFKKDVTIEDFVNRKNCKIDKMMLKKFKEIHPDYRRKTISNKEIIQNITRYCQKDSIIFINYMEKINNSQNIK
ncbi:hypothetical protein KAI04_02675 [Candidatus Pacearchaeota archaeon]|nr:hypothetical protein [Candidatus Pacearchaeota archaeon]